MELVEKKLSSEEIFAGRILRVHRDTVLLPNGKTAFREVADHPGGVAIVALTEKGEVFLVEQYRYAFGRTMVEIPAGNFAGCTWVLGGYDILVDDNGFGVKDENLDRLFTPNFTTKSGGTGLGLAICRNIVEKCDGTITYSKSFILGGASFTVTIPKHLG
mgnify:CR=1 FL=1